MLCFSRLISSLGRCSFGLHLRGQRQAAHVRNKRVADELADGPAAVGGELHHLLKHLDAQPAVSTGGGAEGVRD